MVKVVKYLPKSEAAVHQCLQPVTEKPLFISVFINEVVGLQLNKKKLRQRCFPVSLLNISEHFLCKTCLSGDCYC